MAGILKRLAKTGDQFMTTSDLQNNVEHVLFQAGNSQLSQKFQEKGYSPQVPKMGNKHSL